MDRTMRSLALVLLAARVAAAACTGDFYVSRDGDDARDGRSARTAWRTVQKAADTATAGNTVCILPGSYTERVTLRHSGTPERPIVFRGAEATIHGGDRRATGWTPAPDDAIPGAAGRIWQQDLGYAPVHMTWRGKYVVALEGPHTDWRSALVDGPLTDPSTQACKHPTPGWRYADAVFRVEGRTTYVRFADGHAPNGDDVSFCPAEAATVSTNGQSDVTITGLTIEGCEEAVRVPGGRGVVVRGNVLRHGRRTVHCVGCAHSTFADNDVSLAYGHDMAASSPSHWGVWQVFRVNGRFPRVAFDVGGGTSSDNVVSGNTVHDCFDGISDWDGTDLKPEQYGTNANFTVRGNTVTRCANDAFMAREGGQNGQWYDNRAIDVNYGFRLRVYAGPTYVYRNVVYTADGPALEGGFAYLWQGFPGRVYVYHNSASSRRGIVYGSASGNPSGFDARDGVPHLRVWNNVFSTGAPVEFYSSDWNAGGARGDWRHNWLSNGVPRPPWLDGSNVVVPGSMRLWPVGSVPDFRLPRSASVGGTGLSVREPDPATERPWPGFPDDGTPPIGAVP